MLQSPLLPNLESIALILPRENNLLDLLSRISRRENPTLRKLKVIYYSQYKDIRRYSTTTLPRIDSFLRSPCGHSLTDMTIILEESTTVMWQRLASGLTHNTSIRSFSIVTKQVPPPEGIDLLACWQNTYAMLRP